jgi:NAD(P)-dependent dehydrogenase (short-subunit alcohol dehydrogenase family)
MAVITRSLGGQHPRIIDGVSTFSKTSTAEEVTDGLDLSGQVALVTGCTNGTGLETMRVLALRGAHALATGRTTEKVEKACAGMPGKITPLALELTDLDSVNRCAATIAELGLSPDIVICNAGMMTFGDIELVDGIEKMFFVNFLSHFVLVNNLLPSMLQKGSGRIVHVSSDSAYKKDSFKQVSAKGIEFDNLRGEGAFDNGAMYAQSKLANALFSFELSHRLKETGLTSNAIHPGSVLTNIAHAAPAEMRKAIKDYAPRLKTAAQGAATQVYVATSPDVADVSGKFFEDCNLVDVPQPNYLEDKAMAEKLWRVGEEMAGSHMTLRECNK